MAPWRGVATGAGHLHKVAVAALKAHAVEVHRLSRGTTTVAQEQVEDAADDEVSHV